MLNKAGGIIWEIVYGIMWDYMGNCILADGNVRHPFTPRFIDFPSIGRAQEVLIFAKNKYLFLPKISTYFYKNKYLFLQK